MKDLWREKKRKVMTVEQKECLKPLSVKFLSKLLSRSLFFLSAHKLVYHVFLLPGLKSECLRIRKMHLIKDEKCQKR